MQLHRSRKQPRQRLLLSVLHQPLRALPQMVALGPPTQLWRTTVMWLQAGRSAVMRLPVLLGPAFSQRQFSQVFTPVYNLVLRTAPRPSQTRMLAFCPEVSLSCLLLRCFPHTASLQSTTRRALVRYLHMLPSPLTLRRIQVLVFFILLTI